MVKSGRCAKQPSSQDSTTQAEEDGDIVLHESLAKFSSDCIYLAGQSFLVAKKP